MIKENDRISILLKDGTEATGTVEKVTARYLILDDEGAFGDMVVINFSDIENSANLNNLYSIASEMIDMRIKTKEDIKAYGFTDCAVDLIYKEMREQ